MGSFHVRLLWWTVVLLLAGLYSQRAGAEDVSDWPWLVSGSWLVAVEGTPLDRFLLLPKVKAQSLGEYGAEGASYGYLDGRGKALHGFRMTVSKDSAVLQFVTPADSVVTVSVSKDASSVLGSLKPLKGAEKSVRMTKISESEMQTLRSASHLEKTLSSLKVTASSSITFLYVGARDCPACRGYESEYFGRKDMMKTALPEFSKVTYVPVHLGSYTGCSGLAGMLPAELSALARGSDEAPAPLRCGGTPFFAVVLDGKVVSKGHGMAALETLIFPTLRDLAKRRGV